MEFQNRTHGVNSVLSSNGVRSQEIHNFVGGKARVVETVDDHVDGVLGFGDKARGRGLSGVGTTGHELQTGTTHAVANTDGTGELDAEEGNDVRPQPSRQC